MSACRSCGAGITWAITEDGKRIPLDDPPIRGALVTVGELDDGTTIVAGGIAWISHFATCPQAGEWRRKRG